MRPPAVASSSDPIEAIRRLAAIAAIAGLWIANMSTTTTAPTVCSAQLANALSNSSGPD
jgi:hypothetical protein